MADAGIKKYLFMKASSSRIPISGTFELTPRCNLNCKMCYISMNKDEQAHIGKELTTDEWIKLGEEAVKRGMIYLLLTGGEPMLRPDFCEIYKAMIKMGVVMSVNTNGTRITPEIVSIFSKHPPEKVSISLYGASPETYAAHCGSGAAFHDAMQGILALKRAGIYVNLNTTFTKDNVSDMEAIVGFAKKENIPVRMTGFLFPPIRNGRKAGDFSLTPEETGRSQARFDKLTLTPDQTAARRVRISSSMQDASEDKMCRECGFPSCIAGKGAFWLSWDGMMYPCGMLPERAVDVRKSGFDEAWKETCKSMDNAVIPTECLTCKYKSVCPICTAVPQTLSGATDIVPHALCRQVKAYVDEFMTPFGN
ncbi:MAG: radical SAM/SPASM domain-containing protein [Eubacteriales bacterium]